MTENGKVDTARLPVPSRPAGTRAPAAPAAAADDLAGALLDVWCQVFGFAVELSDDFFELGGNSLLAVRMTAVMRERKLPALHPRLLYLHPTVSRLAAALRS